MNRAAFDVVVCIKVRREGDRRSAPNPSDRAALEMAMDLKRQYSEVTVTVLAVDGECADGTVQFFVACGADRAQRVAVEAGVEKDTWLDAYGTATLFSKAIALGDYQLVLCGNQTSGEQVTSIAPLLSEFQGLPLVRDVVAFDLEEGAASGLRPATVTCKSRRSKGNRQRITCQLPALITVDSLYAESPPYISLRRERRAMQQPVELLSLPQLGMDENQVRTANRSQLMDLHTPRPRVKHAYQHPPTSYAEKMKYFMSGGISQDAVGQLVEGDADQIAEQMMDFLAKNNLLELPQAEGALERQ